MSHKQWEYGQQYIANPEIFGGRPKAGLNLKPINNAGQAGWELVGIVPFTTAHGEVMGAFYLFKREVLEGSAGGRQSEAPA